MIIEHFTLHCNVIVPRKRKSLVLIKVVLMWIQWLKWFLSELLDKHAKLKNIKVVDRPLNEWMTDNILALKAICRKYDLIWPK